MLALRYWVPELSVFKIVLGSKIISKFVTGYFVLFKIIDEMYIFEY